MIDNYSVSYSESSVITVGNYFYHNRRYMKISTSWNLTERQRQYSQNIWKQKLLFLEITLLGVVLVVSTDTERMHWSENLRFNYCSEQISHTLRKIIQLSFLNIRSGFYAQIRMSEIIEKTLTSFRHRCPCLLMNSRYLWPVGQVVVSSHFRASCKKILKNIKRDFPERKVSIYMMRGSYLF